MVAISEVLVEQVPKAWVEADEALGPAPPKRLLRLPAWGRRLFFEVGLHYIISSCAKPRVLGFAPDVETCASQVHQIPIGARAASAQHIAASSSASAQHLAASSLAAAQQLAASSSASVQHIALAPAPTTQALATTMPDDTIMVKRSLFKALIDGAERVSAAAAHNVTIARSARGAFEDSKWMGGGGCSKSGLNHQVAHSATR